MQTKNVHYSEQPERVMVSAKGGKAVIEFPIGITEIALEEGKDYVAETVYSFETMNTPNLKERVEANYDAWLELAKKPEPQTTALEDVVDALNALTEIVLGGEI